MIITPLEIQKKSFKRSLRGYQPSEVNAYLHSLANAWEKMIEKEQVLKKKLEDTQHELNRLKEIEQALLESTRRTESHAQHIIDQAEKKAALMIGEAELTAREVLENATRMVNSRQTTAKQWTSHLKGLTDMMQNHLNDLEELSEDL